MQETNLSGELNNLPEEASRIISGLETASRAAGVDIYLVGGPVRDLLLGRPVCDIDISVDGDAVSFAADLDLGGGRMTAHRPFGTVSIQLEHYRVDLATLRSESYKRPGALPEVGPGDLRTDLYRRDFTINAMAVSLNPRDRGSLIDLFGGLADLENGLIRVLHAESFADDPTRIWRAVRYEQRLGFEIEPGTLGLIEQDRHWLRNVSGERVRYELECVLNEDEPEKALVRLEGLGVLEMLNPALAGDGWISAKYRHARELYRPGRPPRAAYLALLFYRLEPEALAEVLGYLHFDKPTQNTLRDTMTARDRLGRLGGADAAPSTVFKLLDGLDPSALSAANVAADSKTARKNIGLYRDKLREIKTFLSGEDLIALGVMPGPQVKKLLDGLLEARLDGQVYTRGEEKEWVSRKIQAEPTS
jgi:tRNA nucleotidyltransferase (CCA-adding enzyme)